MRPVVIVERCTYWLVPLLWCFVVAAARGQEPQAAAPSSAAEAALTPQPGQLWRVITPGAELHLRDKSILHLPRGVRISVSKVRSGWIGGYAQIDGERQAGWIRASDLATAPQSALIEDSIAQLEALGVKIERDVHGVPHSASAENARLTDDEMRLFLSLVDLVEIDLSETPIGDEALEAVAALAGLERLHLNETAVTDAGIAQLAVLKNLQGLSLANTKITDKSLAQIGKLTNLKVLNLGETAITDAGLAHLEPLAGIETLTLNRTKITGAGFAALADFQNLITLNLDGCPLEAGALAHFHKLQKIRILRMYDTTAPAADIEALENAVDGLAIFH